MKSRAGTGCQQRRSRNQEYRQRGTIELRTPPPPPRRTHLYDGASDIVGGSMAARKRTRGGRGLFGSDDVLRDLEEAPHSLNFATFHSAAVSPAGDIDATMAMQMSMEEDGGMMAASTPPPTKRSRRSNVSLLPSPFSFCASIDESRPAAPSSSPRAVVARPSSAVAAEWWKRPRPDRPSDNAFAGAIAEEEEGPSVPPSSDAPPGKVDDDAPRCYACRAPASAPPACRVAPSPAKLPPVAGAFGGRNHNSLLSYFSSAAAGGGGVPKTPANRRAGSSRHRSLVLAPCAYCDHRACPSCSRQCEMCTRTFCTFCSTVDYDRSVAERVLCFECDSTERHGGAGDGDGDMDMMM